MHSRGDSGTFVGDAARLAPSGKERFPRPGIDGRKRRQGGQAMLGLVVTLLIIALIAAVLGFGGIAGAAVGMAKIVFFVALVLFLISLVFGFSRGSLRW
jgi:uncharacterized membrane protein YtjA (UPF0391 family)